MKSFLSLLIAFITISANLHAAEAGMPQLDPTYWASQAFWLILVFVILYISISKYYLPRIKDNLDNRENKISDDLDEAKELNQLAEEKSLDYEKEISFAKDPSKSNDIFETFGVKNDEQMDQFFKKVQERLDKTKK